MESNPILMESGLATPRKPSRRAPHISLALAKPIPTMISCSCRQMMLSLSGWRNCSHTPTKSRSQLPAPFRPAATGLRNSLTRVKREVATSASLPSTGSGSAPSTKISRTMLKRELPCPRVSQCGSTTFSAPDQRRSRLLS